MVGHQAAGGTAAHSPLPGSSRPRRGAREPRLAAPVSLPRAALQATLVSLAPQALHTSFSASVLLAFLPTSSFSCFNRRAAASFPPSETDSGCPGPKEDRCEDAPGQGLAPAGSWASALLVSRIVGAGRDSCPGTVLASPAAGWLYPAVTGSCGGSGPPASATPRPSHSSKLWSSGSILELRAPAPWQQGV